MHGNGGSRRAFLAASAALAASGFARAGEVAAVPPRRIVHLNTASLGRTPPTVLERVVAAWRQLESEPVMQAYRPDPGTVLAMADAVRAKAAAFLGCTADEVLVTTGTTNGMATVAQALTLAAGDRVLTTNQEHEGAEVAWQYRSARDGVAIDTVAIGLDEHDHDAIMGRLAAAITPRTRVISVSHVLTSSGLRMPVQRICALARERNVLCIVDGAQAVGGIAVDVRAIGCHAYATSGHKWLMGPKGTGLLYVANEAQERIRLLPWVLGHRYGGQSMGVGPMPLAIGLGVAVDELAARSMATVERHNLALRERAWHGLGRVAGVELLGPPPGPAATPLVAFRIPDRFDSEAMRKRLLEAHGIVVKMAEKRWFNGLRLSPHVINDERDIDTALAVLAAELR